MQKARKHTGKRNTGGGFAAMLSELKGKPLQKLLAKVPEWQGVADGLRVPAGINAEQCSSSATGRYKARLALSLASGNEVAETAANRPGEDRRKNADVTTFPSGDTASKSQDESILNGTVQGQTGRGDAGNTLSGRIADLTGGLGVDSWFFSRYFGEVLYCERNPELAEAAVSNFRQLEAGNIRCICHGSASDDATAVLLEEFSPDVIYLDPARRNSSGNKVFLLEDCEPDLCTMLPMLLEKAPVVLVKVSPMADITMLERRIGRNLAAVHIIQSKGEVKELLLVISRHGRNADALPLTVAEADSGAILQFSREEEVQAGAVFADVSELSATAEVSGQSAQDAADAAPLKAEADTDEGNRYRTQSAVLFEPGPALLKSGAFKLLCSRFSARKLSSDSHLYLCPEGLRARPDNPCVRPIPAGPDALQTADSSAVNYGDAENSEPSVLAYFGKFWRICEVLPLNSTELKNAGKRYPDAEVSARGIPMTSEELRRRLGCFSGGNIHIFGVTALSAGTPTRRLLICERG